MRKPIWGGAAVAALAATAVALGGPGADGPGTSLPAADHARAFPVAGAGTTPAVRPASRRRRVVIVYRQTKPQTVPPGDSAFEAGPCPGEQKVLGGYYFYEWKQGQPPVPDPPVIDLGGSPAGSVGEWRFYRRVPLNATGEPESVYNVVYGIICARNVR